MVPLVSINIPSYNCERTILETLNSLINQTYPRILIQIFDNQSTDSTVEIIRDFQKDHENVLLHINESNLGSEGNFTRCTQQAQGDYFAIFHSDDIYLPKAVELMVSALESCPEASGVAIHAHTIGPTGIITGERFLPEELKKNYSTKLSFQQLLELSLKYGNIITCPGVMARTQLFRDNIKSWNGERYKTSADLDVWLRLAQFGPIIYLSKPLMNYRVAEMSYSYNLKKVRVHKHDLFLVLDDYLEAQRDHLSPQSIDQFNFLLFKDSALRSWNLMKSHQLDLIAPMNLKPIPLWTTFKTSSWHRKYLFLSLLIYALNQIVLFFRPKKAFRN